MKNVILLLLMPVYLFSQKNYSSELDKYMQAQYSVKGFHGIVQVTKAEKVMLKNNYGIVKDSIEFLLSSVSKHINDSVSVKDTLENHLRVRKRGSFMGYSFKTNYFPGDDASIILVTNDDKILTNRLPISTMIMDGLAGIVYDLPVEVPYVHKEVAIDPSLLDKFVGKYKAFLILEIIKKDGKLWRHRDGSPDIELKPESDRKFFYADNSNRQLDFELDKEGKITKIWFVNNEQRGEMTRL